MERNIRILHLLREEVREYLDENIELRTQQVYINFKIPSNCPKCNEDLIELYFRPPTRTKTSYSAS